MSVMQGRIPRLIAAGLLLVLAGVVATNGVLAAPGGVPRAEHPRPDAFRENWVTLNGEWEFEIDEAGDGVQRGLSHGKTLGSKIVVPFCPESSLSGVGHYGLMKNVWYRRSFDLPATMRGKRVLLHFGAVDFQTTVWVNGEPAGTHVGGSVSFAFDITSRLRDGANEIVVRAFDDTPSGKQPTGKQTFTVSEGCMYTRTTGIWQPVWLEAVGTSYVGNFSVVTDPVSGRVSVSVAVDGVEPGMELEVEAFADGKRVGRDTCAASDADSRLAFVVSRKKLWEPGAPFLYDLNLTLRSGGRVVDQVRGYFGLRKVEIQGRAILINGKRVFQRLILDQGFYPDGIWTAPTDEALKHDIELSMTAGYNGARLHQKVFEPRFLYWADKLGYLVWGEFPNWGFNFRPENYSNYINEWTEVLLRDRNHPAIIGWCPFNETPAESGELQRIIWHETRAIDPTRPVLETSGWSHSLEHPVVRDEHDYNQDPATFSKRWLEFFGGSGAGEGLSVPARYSGGASPRVDLGVPFMVSEFGGTFWGEKQGGWGYGSGPTNLAQFYSRYGGLVSALLDNPDMFGFCYTQLTDVEQEHNGLYFYDRRPKFDAKILKQLTSRQAAYERAGPSAKRPARRVAKDWRVLVGGAPDGDLCRPYRYTTNAPAAAWSGEAFDDASWVSSLPPFGTIANPRTAWTTSDIWLRRSFEWDGGSFAEAALAIFYDEDTEVYVNGQRIWNRSGFATSYQVFAVGEQLKAVLKKGANTLAVHTHQTGGGQFIDLAVLLQ